MKLRDCIICLPVAALKEPPSSETHIVAMCGTCRTDVWLSKRLREKFTNDPEQYTVACIPCAYDMHSNLLNRMPDLVIQGKGVVGVEMKYRQHPDIDAIIFPTWLIGDIDLCIPGVIPEPEEGSPP